MQTFQRCQVFDIPGTPGLPGTNGANGASGSNAWASLVAAFTMPAQLGTGVATLDHTDWMAVNEAVFVEGLGTLIVQSISNPNVTLLNPQNGAGLYVANLPPGTVSPSTSRITPTGTEGPSGGVAGVAGGDLTGNYPNPLLKNTGTPGTAGDATHVSRVTTDAAGRVTAMSAVAITFPAISGSAGGDLTGTYPNPALAASGVVAGTYGSEEVIPRLVIDTKGRTTSVTTKQPRYGILGKLTSVDLNTAGDTTITINSTRFIVRRIIIEAASINLTVATAGVFFGATPIASNQALTACSASNKFFDFTLAAAAGTDVLTGNLTFRVGTPQGAAAIGNVWVEGENLG